MKQADADTRRALDAFRRLVQALRLPGRGRRGVLPSAQLFALQRIAEHPGVSVNDLAALTCTDQSSVSVVVDRLVAHRFVVRAAARDDRRRRTLAPTAAGRRALAGSPAPPQDRLIAAMAALAPADRRRLARVLERLARSVAPERMAAPPPMLFEEE